MGATILPAVAGVSGAAASASPAASKQRPTFAAAFRHTRRHAAVHKVTAPAAGWYQVVIADLRKAQEATTVSSVSAPSTAQVQAAIVRAAMSQLGRTDAAVYGGSAGEWCAAFASWVYRSAGLHIPVLTAAYEIGSWGFAQGWTLLPPSAKPQVGDAVLFEPNGSGKAWPGRGLDITNIAHVNIIVSVGPGDSFKTIGGNERGAVRGQGWYSAADAPSWWGQTVYGLVRPV